MTLASSAQVDLMWTVAVGMGVAVFFVVVVLLHLLFQSVRSLDRRVDQVWSAAVGLFVHTLTAAPQLRVAERQVVSVTRESGAETTKPVRNESRF
jgi:hypothetical protein